MTALKLWKALTPVQHAGNGYQTVPQRTCDKEVFVIAAGVSALLGRCRLRSDEADSCTGCRADILHLIILSDWHACGQRRRDPRPLARRLLRAAGEVDEFDCHGQSDRRLAQPHRSGDQQEPLASVIADFAENSNRGPDHYGASITYAEA